MKYGYKQKKFDFMKRKQYSMKEMKKKELRKDQKIMVQEKQQKTISKRRFEKQKDQQINFHGFHV